MLERIKQYLSRGLWDFSLREKNLWVRILYKIQRILILSIRGFFLDGCALRASSLTFYTLLSVVPLLALAFAIAQGFGFQAPLKAQLLDRFSDNREILMQVFQFSDRFLEKAKGGVIAGAGALVLFWSATSLLASMESTFNRIWKVKKLRNWRRIFSDYLAIILIAPLLFFLSSSLSLYIAGLMKETIHVFLGETYVGSAMLFFVGWVPYALLWIFYALLYYLLPNTCVRFSSALAGGFVAGFLSLIVQAAYLFFQIFVTHYSAIYGSFAAVPLFLIWVQVNWFILLFGVEISCACQTQEMAEYALSTEKMSSNLQLAITLWVARAAMQRILQNQPVAVELLVREDRIPYSIVAFALKQLVDAKILAELKDRRIYLPQSDIRALRIVDVIDALQKKGENSLTFPAPGEFLSIEDLLRDFGKLLSSSPKNLFLKDLI